MIHLLLIRWLKIIIKKKIFLLNKNLNKTELQPNGSYSSSSENVFITILICRLLSESSEMLSNTEPHFDETILKTIRKSDGLITNEKLVTEDWNYWMKNSQNYVTRPCPSDLDDTLNAHYVLQHINKDYFNSAVLYSITQKLLNTEDENGGYNTWIGSDIHDIDPVVQVIVYKFLLKIKSVPDSFQNFLIVKLQGISKDFWHSKYYDSKLYILSELTSLLPILNTSIENQTKAYDSLYQCYKSIPVEYPTHNPYERILRSQIELNLGMHKLWDSILLIIIPIYKIKAGAIFIESLAQDVKTYCYSRGVILALYIKVLSTLYSRLSKHHSKKDQSAKEGNYTTVHKNLIDSIKHYPKAELLIKNIFKEDDTLRIVHGELYDFYQGVKDGEIFFLNFETNEKRRYNQKTKDLNSIYLAILLGWVAYTAYDSILDGEISTTYIPLANTCNIKMIRVLTDNELTNKIPHLREFMFRKLVELNTPNNEIAKQSMQGQKSIGHCIGPICIFSLVTKNWVHSDIFHLENYYANYLSLKQLSDDIHDWKEDIFADRKTYVTELILKQYNTSVKSQTISTEEIFCSYMETFTNSTIYIVHQEMMKQTESALYHLSMISQHFKPAYLKSKIKDTEKYVAGIKQAINEIELYNLYCYT